MVPGTSWSCSGDLLITEQSVRSPLNGINKFRPSGPDNTHPPIMKPLIDIIPDHVSKLFQKRASYQTIGWLQLIIGETELLHGRLQASQHH